MRKHSNDRFDVTTVLQALVRRKTAFYKSAVVPEALLRSRRKDQSLQADINRACDQTVEEYLNTWFVVLVIKVFATFADNGILPVFKISG